MVRNSPVEPILWGLLITKITICEDIKTLRRLCVIQVS